MVNFDQNKPLIDPITGIVNEDVAIHNQKRDILFHEIAAGADGSSDDMRGCREIYDNLSQELHYTTPDHTSKI